MKTQDNSALIRSLRAMPTSDLMRQAADVIEQQDKELESIGAGGVSPLGLNPTPETRS